MVMAQKSGRCDLRVNEGPAYSRRQLLAKAATAASRVAAYLCVGVRLSWCQNASVQIQGVPTGAACTFKMRPTTAPSAPPSRVIPTAHDCFIHFDERPLDYRLRQSVPLQYLIIERHQHFELCKRCLPKALV